MITPKRQLIGLAILAIGMALCQPMGGATYRGLFVGVNEFDYADPLEGCDWDAARLRDAYTRGGYCANADARLIVNQGAKKKTVRARFNALADVAIAGDTVVYYQSSHGGNHVDGSYNDTKKAYLCLTDARYEDTEFADDLSKFAKNVRVVVILDACNSGGMFKSAEGETAKKSTAWDFAGSVERLLEKHRAAANEAGTKGDRGTGADIAWITASDWNETSSEFMRNGEFTSSLLRGWENASADEDGGDLSFGELAEYARNNVYHSNVQTKNDALLANIPAGTAFDVSSYRLLAANGIVAGFLGTCPSAVVIPEGTRTIAFSAFDADYSDVSALESVSLPESLNYIGTYAFYGCDGLTTVVVPNSVFDIGEDVFARCYNLEMLYLPQMFLAYLDYLGVPDDCGVASTDAYCFVNHLYQLCLGRNPDSAGCAYWAKGLTSGTKNAAMTAYGFFMGKEMERRKLSNADYVEILYRTLMERAPDSKGKAHWVELLNSGVSRVGVFRGFAESAEFTKICDNYALTRGNVDKGKLESRDLNTGVTLFVARCYTKALNRKYDLNGLNYWCDKINSSSTKKAMAIQVAKSFFSSAEFQRRRLSNSAFVDVLYQTFLGRAPDTAGKKYWLGKLNSGVSKNTVMAGFYNSKEFASLMAGCGIR